MKKRLTLLVAVALAAAVASVAALASSKADPGINSRVITLGGTFPLSGPASSYAPIPVGMKAYFSYANARRAAVDKKRGVRGRQIKWIYYDDGYNPANTVQQTRKLVEQDKVFALFGGLGTEPQEAVRNYLNDQKVPQMFVSTGATEFGSQFTQYPYTMGWQPDYQAEGAIYGKYIVANQGTKKIAVILQNDSYGNDYLDGLKAGLGPKQSNIVSTQRFEVTAPSVGQQVAALKASGADILCIFATPAKTIQTYATMKALSYKPDNIYLNSVSATDTFMKLAVQNAGADLVNGSVSVAYGKDPASPLWAKDPAVILYKKIIAKYAPTANANDALVYYGVSKAYDAVQLLYAAGKNPTRASLLAAAQKMSWTNPFSLPGVTVKTSANDRFPISQVKLQRYNNGLWNTFGPLINGRGK